MKNFYLVIALSIFASSNLLGRILNGYEQQLPGKRVLLQQLKKTLSDDKAMSFAQRLLLRSDIENVVSYISCYELTEELIRQMKVISPRIFNEINRIRDRRGRPTDVYVKLIEKEQVGVPLRGATFFEQSLRDKDQSISEYGENTVVINIRICDNALFLLAHEFGHVKYVVPDLATYFAFYNKHYDSKGTRDLSFIGHHRLDLSGKSACAFEKLFLADKRSYRRTGHNKFPSVATLFNQALRTNRKKDVVTSPQIMALHN